MVQGKVYENFKNDYILRYYIYEFLKKVSVGPWPTCLDRIHWALLCWLAGLWEGRSYGKSFFKEFLRVFLQGEDVSHKRSKDLTTDEKLNFREETISGNLQKTFLGSEECRFISSIFLYFYNSSIFLTLIRVFLIVTFREFATYI